MPNFSFNDGNTANRIISSILGESWHNMFSEGPTGDLAGLIVSIFQIFNSVVILATALIVGYSLWSGVVQTAHEGKALGKRYSSLWTPIRMAMGAGLTAPVFGVSLVQMIVLAVAGLSFSVADDVANELGDFMAKGGSIAISSPMMQKHDAHRVAAALMYAETCKEYKNANEFDVNMVSGADNWVEAGWYRSSWFYGKPGVMGFGDNLCGSLDVKYKEDGPYTADIKAGIQDMAGSLQPAAKAIVTNQIDVPESYYSSAVSRYESMLSTIVEKAKAGGDEDLRRKSEAIRSSIAEHGWINLGMWYYTIMSISATRSQSTQFSFDYIAPEQMKLDGDLGGLSEYYNRAGGYVSRSATSMQAGSANPVSPSDISGEANESLVTTLMGILDTDGDPFLTMVNVGQEVFGWGLVAYTGGKAMEYIPGFLSFLKDTPLGAGGKVVSVVGSATSFVAIIMIGLGAWLGWYLPMLPFVNWVVGVIGVFISIAQSLFASQIWAAAHAMPEGEGLAGTHAKQGYMLLISLALRPVLIVMGFIFSYYILWAGCWLSIQGLKVYVQTISTGTFSSYFGVIVALVVSAILVTTILHRSLGFIFESADDILTWIGGGRQLGSEQSTVQRALGAFAMVIQRGNTLRGLGSAMSKGGRAVKAPSGPTAGLSK